MHFIFRSWHPYFVFSRSNSHRISNRYRSWLMMTKGMIITRWDFKDMNIVINNHNTSRCMLRQRFVHPTSINASVRAWGDSIIDVDVCQDDDDNWDVCITRNWYQIQLRLVIIAFVRGLFIAFVRRCRVWDMIFGSEKCLKNTCFCTSRNDSFLHFNACESIQRINGTAIDNECVFKCNNGTTINSKGSTTRPWCSSTLAHAHRAPFGTAK